MEDRATSVNNVPIRLTEERWLHIISEHEELASLREQVVMTISQPERILAGHLEELLAVQEIEPGKWLVVIYREFDADGFVITAFLTRRHRSLNKRSVIWTPPT